MWQSWQCLVCFCKPKERVFSSDSWRFGVDLLAVRYTLSTVFLVYICLPFGKCMTVKSLVSLATSTQYCIVTTEKQPAILIFSFLYDWTRCRVKVSILSSWSLHRFMGAFYSWVKLYDLVRTSSLQRLMMQESSNRIGNQPRTQTRSPGATFMSSLVYSLRACTWTQQEVKKWGGKRKNKTTESRTKTGVFPARAVSTCGLSETYLAQCRMSLMASMLVSGKAALHTNSDRHFTASWKESIAAAKCSRKVFTDKRQKHAK